MAREISGVDPLYLANEGKLVTVVVSQDADKALEAVRSHPLGEKATIICTVQEDPYRFVQMRALMGVIGSWSGLLGPITAHLLTLCWE